VYLLLVQSLISLHSSELEEDELQLQEELEELQEHEQEDELEELQELECFL